MATIPVDTPKLRPTEGQLALARLIAEGHPRETRGMTHVPAAVYTDPAWFAREKAALLKLVATADAFVHALRPQAIEGLGLGYEAIRKIKPDIVYVGAYGYSADGPYGKLPAYDDAIQARFGIADLMGRAAGDDVPRYPPTIIADKTVGLAFACATLSALMHRQRTGEGQRVRTSLARATMAAQAAEYSTCAVQSRPKPLAWATCCGVTA